MKMPPHIENAAVSFAQNYEQISFIQDEKKRKQFVAGSDTCRYCGKNEPDVAFTDECHVLVNSIGNRRLFAEDECEKCNKFFGRTIEDHFGKWSLPYRVISCVRGKDGFPSIKRDGWRIDATENGIVVEMFTTHQIAQIDEENKTTYLPLPRDAFVPVMVYKAFVRMAMSMLPRDQLSDFQDVLTWLKTEDPTVSILNQCSRVLVSEYPIFPNVNSVAAFVYRRKTPDKNLPYMVFVLAFANYAFQCFIPAPVGTQNENFTATVHPFLTGPFNPPSLPKNIPLNGTEKVRGEIVPFSIGALEMLSEELDWHANVARKAYSLWEAEGSMHGFDQKHWFEAEELLRQEGEKRRKDFFPDRSK